MPALTSAARDRLTALTAYLEANSDRLTIDADVHPTDRSALPPEHETRIVADPNYYHTRPYLSEELIARMDLADVDMALCWQNPGVLPYSDDRTANDARLTAANASISALADRHPERVIPAGWTDPKALGLDGAIRLARR